MKNRKRKKQLLSSKFTAIHRHHASNNYACTTPKKIGIHNCVSTKLDCQLKQTTKTCLLPSASVPFPATNNDSSSSSSSSSSNGSKAQLAWQQRWRHTAAFCVAYGGEWCRLFDGECFWAVLTAKRHFSLFTGAISSFPLYFLTCSHDVCLSCQYLQWIFICMYVCMYVCLFVCMYVFVYVYKYIYIYIYKYNRHRYNKIFGECNAVEN